MKYEFKQRPGQSNEVMDLSPEAFVSYNQDAGDNPVAELCTLAVDILTGIGGMEGPPGGEQEETSLCIGGIHCILKGDWRERYTGAAREGGTMACAKLFDEAKNNHPEQVSFWNECKETDATALLA